MDKDQCSGPWFKIFHNPGSTKMYHDRKPIYWWDDMKKDIAKYLAKSFNCKKDMAKNHNPCGRTLIIEVPTLKWEEINIDFIVGVRKTRRQHNSIWVIVDRMSMFAHFIPMKSTYKAAD